MLETTFQPTHHYVSVSAQSFPHLDLTFYDRTANGLRAKRFRSLADVEDTEFLRGDQQRDDGVRLRIAAID